MNGFLLIEEYGMRLFLMNGSIVQNTPSDKLIFGLPAARTKTVARLNRVTANGIDDAVKELNAAANNLRIR